MSQRRLRAPSLPALPLLPALLVGVAACGSNSDNGSENSAPSTATESDFTKKEEPPHPDTDGLVVLMRGNSSAIYVYDTKSGKEKASSFLPQYAERNAWGRNAFTPDWSTAVYTSDDRSRLVPEEQEQFRRTAAAHREPRGRRGRAGGTAPPNLTDFEILGWY